MSSVRTPDAAANLSDWLQYLESIHATAIDMGLDRVRQVADRMALSLPGIKFVVGGTNGKGSTCAMLEAILLAAGYKVGLYTSPHLIDFNERARVNGQIASDQDLITQFQAVEAARGDVSLTYFEFTTLAILRLFSQSRLDAVVLEVGLGGRLDAVNIVDADCAIVTSVDLDHTDWLGDTREKIGFEKAHIYRSGRPAICSDPVPPQSLLDYVQEIGADLWLFGRDYNYSGDRQQWAYGGREQRRSAMAYPALRGANQLLNASAALAALESVRDRLPVQQQAVRLGLLQASLPGRFQILPGQPTVILDVAHNPHAAAVLAQNLDNMGFHPYTHAVFGMLNDKDLAGVVAKLGSRVDYWYCAGLPGPRGTPGQALADQALLEGRSAPASAAKPEAAKPAAAKGNFVLQIAAYTTSEDAQSRRGKLHQAGVTNAFVEQATINGKQQYRLRVGPFPSREAAQAAQARLRTLGYDNGFIAAQ
ncbi:bifunctional tetrahydrofolate synthase/dihydrofolate synthase [Achromobacter sp. KAs 3-5]|nr:bifunctional tetrahydrofolate synthase/dihydrofolate synthase [Achromobacter sp. KAs 3-5]